MSSRISTLFLTILLALTGNTLLADDPVFASKDANAAMSQYHREVSKLDATYKGRLAEWEARYVELKNGHRATLLAKLEEAKGEAAKEVKLAEANKLQEAINKFKQEAPQEPGKKPTKRDLKANTPENRAAFEKLLVGSQWVTARGSILVFKPDYSTETSWHKQPTLWVIVAPYKVKAITNDGRDITFMQFDEEMKSIATNHSQWRRR